MSQHDYDCAYIYLLIQGSPKDKFKAYIAGGCGLGRVYDHIKERRWGHYAERA